MLRRPLLLLCLALGTSAGAAEPLRVVFGVSRPPFVDEKSQSGISVDLFREATQRLGLGFRAEYAPNKRMLMLLEQGQVDVAVEVPRELPGLHYSTPFISYSNAVLSLRAAGLEFRDWPDLAGRSVCAWQLAEQGLGARFAAARPSFAMYQEFGNQRDQVRLWLLGRCEALVIDRQLVLWHIGQLARNEPRLRIPRREELVFAPLPGASDLDWFLGFRDAALRDRFNAALAAMRADGSYQRIVERHLLGGP